MFWSDPRAGVGDHDPHSVTVLSADLKRAPVRHRVLSIQEEIKEDLLQLAAVAHNAGQLDVDLALDMNSSRFELVFEQRQRILDHSVQVDKLELTAAGAREIQEAVDDFGGAESLLSDLLQNR